MECQNSPRYHIVLQLECCFENYFGRNLNHMQDTRTKPLYPRVHVEPYCLDNWCLYTFIKISKDYIIYENKCNDPIPSLNSLFPYSYFNHTPKEEKREQMLDFEKENLEGFLMCD